MGLGVYDNHHTLLLECGATNLRTGTDAAGFTPPPGSGTPIDPTGKPTLHGPGQVRGVLFGHIRNRAMQP
eukprot:7019128-Pyramimonas_sp.AAC.1